MALNFPNTGLYVGLQYTGENGITYIYDGVKWVGHSPTLAPGTNSLVNGSNVVQVDGDGNLVIPDGAQIIYQSGAPAITSDRLISDAGQVVLGATGQLTVPDSNFELTTPSAGSGNKNIDIFTNNFASGGVEVYLAHNSGVSIYTDNGNYGWFFDKTGQLTLPHVAEDVYSSIIGATNNININANGAFWKFASDGYLSLPNRTLAVPSRTSRNESITLYDFNSVGSQVNYGIGVSDHAIWMTTDSNTAGFDWYGGEDNRVMRLDGNGTINVTNRIKRDGGNSSLSFDTNSVYLTPVTDDFAAVYMDSNSAQMYAPGNVTISTAKPRTDITAVNQSDLNNNIVTIRKADYPTITQVTGQWTFWWDNTNYYINNIADTTADGTPNADYVTFTLSDTTLAIGIDVGVTFKSPANWNSWAFNSDGALTFPDNTTQTTAYPGPTSTGYILTVGDSPNYYTEFNVVTQDDAGNTYYCGSTSGFTPGTSPVILKVDSNGSVLWQAVLGLEGVVTGAYVYSGYLALTVQTTPAGDPIGNAWLVSLVTDTGAIDNINSFDQTDGDVHYFHDLILGQYNNAPFFAGQVGYMKFANTGLKNGFVVFNSIGTVAYTITDGVSDVEYFGIANDPVSGDTWGVGAYGTQSLISYESSNSIVWHKSIDLGRSNQAATSVAYSNGFIYVVSSNFDNQQDAFLTKMNATTGAIIWQKGWGYGQSGDPMGSGGGCVTVDGHGNILVANTMGSAYSRIVDILILKFAPDGSNLWQRSLGTSGAEYSDMYKSSEFLTADADHFYIAGATSGGPSSNGIAIQLSLDGTGTGSYGDWLYVAQQWNIVDKDVSANSTDLTGDFTATPYTVSITNETGSISNDTPVVSSQFIGGGVTTGDLTFANATIRGPAGSIDNYRVRIQPSTTYANTLAIYPTGDNDIHIFEDSPLGGGVTLGDYGKSNISVWGNGGTSTTVDDITLTAVNAGKITLTADKITLTTGNGTVRLPEGNVVCNTGVDTVVYTAADQYHHTFKLLLKVEGFAVANTDPWDTQSTEMIIAKSFNGDKVAASAYGVVYTSTDPLATFSARWNPSINRVEVLCRPTSLTYGVEVKTYATEITTSD